MKVFLDFYHISCKKNDKHYQAQGIQEAIQQNCLLYKKATSYLHPLLPHFQHVYPAANWHERETFDMFGIHFSNHPNLKRILMWDEYPYYPLRKEFPLAGIDTPLPAADVVEVTQASVEPAPMMGGPFVSSNSNSGPISNSEPRAKDESWTERKEKPL